jgi:hypothetical protein
MYVNILDIIRLPISYKTQRFRASICPRPQVNKRREEGPTLVGPLEKASLFHHQMLLDDNFHAWSFYSKERFSGCPLNGGFESECWGKK